MSQLDSDGVEDVVHGQGRLLVGVAGTAMAAAARAITERTRRQREIALAELAAERAHAEADRRLLLVRLEMAKTDQWRQETPFEQVAETLYLARLYERTEPAAAAAIEDLEDLVRARFDADPNEVVVERAREVADEREAERAFALDALERAEVARENVRENAPEQSAVDAETAQPSAATTAAAPDATVPGERVGGPEQVAPVAADGATPAAGTGDASEMAAATEVPAMAGGGGNDAQTGEAARGAGSDPASNEVDVRALAAQMHAGRGGTATARSRESSPNASDLAARALNQRRAARARTADAERAAERVR